MRPAIDWSRHCGDIAAAAFREARGCDLWELLGGRPGSARDTADLYRRLGVRTLAEVVSWVVGPPLASPRLARRGDVVMAQRSLGVCRGELAEFDGAMLPMRQVDKAWRVV